ncbi:DUF982 domain-containing protein [Agrobacterium rubi]|uniref:DUF982 domain-containing protein n=1 Tax=Agrobacterium rubi TaxID=28099 RepID=UPI0015743F5A|nr:DUF982 domain-containing protein [Agrobacterium rubi]NTF08889.1 DUF982 domain-containing protein [Agrobacterium rubi]NTF21160.1 DUF982 domain-containing protein [Agrobacterium rubi]NTF28017.1 DUF982 domain-containing protein [Agrobacterium rubi]
MTDSTDTQIISLQIEWGSFRTLTSVFDLADCLMQEWPGPSDGEAYVTALMVCDAVLSGGEDDAPEHAREAFINAVHEAGLSILGDGDGPDF